MSGQALKALAKKFRLRTREVCDEAGISTPTLYKVYNDRGAEQESIDKVDQAIQRLVAKVKEVVAAS